MFTTSEDVGRQADILIRLGDQRVGGVALWPTAWEDTPAYHIRHLQERNVPVVLCHRPVAHASAPLVGVSYGEIARMIGKALVQQKHRRVALLNGHRSLASRIYEKTLREVLEESRGVLPQECVYTGDAHGIHSDYEAATSALGRFMALPEPPTAIVSSFVSFNQVLYAHLVKMGQRVPDDVSIVTIGNVHEKNYFSPKPTMVGIDAVALGCRLAEVLEEMRVDQRAIENKERLFMPLEFIQGETLGLANQS